MLRRTRPSYGVLLCVCVLAPATALADDDVGMDLSGSLEASSDDGAEASAESDTDDADDADDADESEPDAAAPAAHGARTSSFGVGLDFYFDDGEQDIQRINSGGGNLVEGTSEISNEGFLLGSDLALVVWWMTEIFENVQLGANLRLLGSYSYEEDGNVIDLGQTLEIGPRAQYLLGVTDTLGVTFGLEGDLVMIIPSGDLGDRIDALDAQGFNTTGAPRLGFLVGPQVGIRYVGSEWIALRADLGWLWEKVFLVDSTAESGGLRGEESWTASWTRWRLHLGTELMF